MKIVRFVAQRIHGHLDFDVKFNAELNFLTGINGAGKTTIVRAMTALLTPSIRDLANLAYQHIAVMVEHDGRVLRVSSERTEEEVTLGCGDDNVALKIPILRSEAYESRRRFLEREHDFYREWEALNAATPVLVALDRLPTPMFLDLERRHQIGTRKRRDDPRMAPANPLAGSVLDSLNDAGALAEDAYRRCAVTRAELTDGLKHEIILTAFRLSEDDDTPQSNLFPPSNFVRQLTQSEKVVERSLLEIGIREQRIEDGVRPFFQRIRDVAAKMPTSRQFREIVENSVVDSAVAKTLADWYGMMPQARQVMRLVDLVSRYNDAVRVAFAPIETYLASINTFLSDSGKSLVFHAAGSLGVSMADDQRRRPLSALSSGERQLVVILTHLAFNPQAKRANVLIVDEPELSLHLRWQELFVDSVTTASPGIQLILATHSPSIIGHRIENCFDVGKGHGAGLFR